MYGPGDFSPEVHYLFKEVPLAQGSVLSVEVRGEPEVWIRIWIEGYPVRQQPQQGETRTFDLPGGASMEFVWIQPGTFWMGSSRDENSPFFDEDARYDEEPRHEVTISQGFWLGKYEVTQSQWTSVMGTTPWEGLGYVQGSADNPAVYISWIDVQELIDGLNMDADAEVYRLPTEAEWEYACRAGTTTRWSFGDDQFVGGQDELGVHAWYDGNAWSVGERYAHSVGTKQPNPWGLYDMHGNADEWCQDWYDSHYYVSSPSVDPAGPDTGNYRVRRGGNFSRLAQFARSATRSLGTPGTRTASIGVRLVRTQD